MKKLPLTLLFSVGLISTQPTWATLIDTSSIGAFRDTVPYDGNFDNGVYTNNATTGWFPVHTSTTSNDAARTAFEFNLSGLGVLSSATLVYSYSFAINTPTIELHGYEGDGVVTRADVATTNVLASVLLPNSWNEPLQDVQFDVTSFVQSLMNSGAGYAGFSLRVKDDLTLGSTAVTNVWSGRVEHFLSGYGSGPRLMVTSIPEPSALAMLVVGLAGMVITRRRVHRQGGNIPEQRSWCV